VRKPEVCIRCGHCKSPLSAPAEPVNIPNTVVVFNSLTDRSALPVLVSWPF
jgi:hypothetical protein